MDTHYNKSDAKKLEDVFQFFLQEASSSNTSESEDVFDPFEIYDGPFADELSTFIPKPLTFRNLQKYLKLINDKEEQIKRLIDKLNNKKEKLENIKYMITGIEENEEFLNSYKSFKFLPSWLVKDKFYKDLKRSLTIARKELTQKFKVSKDNDKKNISSKIKSVKVLLKKLSKLQKLNLSFKFKIIDSMKSLSNKIKGNIKSKHPELSNFINLLSCEQSYKLKVLKEKYNFIPNQKEDFIKAIKETTRDMKRSTIRQPFFKTKLNLLLNVATELDKSVAHQKFLEREQSRPTYRDNGPGRDYTRF